MNYVNKSEGLYYFNARWYSAELGRFITEDPIKDGINWYTYVSNNPLIYIDPTGLAEFGFNEDDKYHAVVEDGDTVSEIADEYYGNGSEKVWSKIAELNDLDENASIKPGDKLLLPDIVSEGEESYGLDPSRHLALKDGEWDPDRYSQKQYEMIEAYIASKQGYGPRLLIEDSFENVKEELASVYNMLNHDISFTLGDVDSDKTEGFVFGGRFQMVNYGKVNMIALKFGIVDIQSSIPLTDDLSYRSGGEVLTARFALGIKSDSWLPILEAMATAIEVRPVGVQVGDYNIDPSASIGVGFSLNSVTSAKIKAAAGWGVGVEVEWCE